MQKKHGFSLIQDTTIHEIRSRARLWLHEATGARVLSLENEDENKVFGASFRTPPDDSTGVAHILEHSVLCGSRKYPVKEPFVELLKGSLQTFLNAFTFPDKTCYPVASANTADFYNLIDVYLDAVFYPRITENIFRQEGWHYELDDPKGPLTRKGVVYNEMKGAYSSPDSLLYEYSQHAVFPDTTYGLDSGGDPDVIPRLTYGAFADFHRNYYHPANAWLYFYGDDDPDERLRILAGYLDDFGPLEVESFVGMQEPFAEPRTVTRSYAAGEGGDAKAMVTVNWLLTPTTEVQRNLELTILEEILVGMPSSPLKKALIESGLGEDVCGAGLETELRQMYFSTGLKGLFEDNVARVEPLVLETLEELSGQGIDGDMVEAAVNSVEFDLRENNTGRFPRGLALMLRSLTTSLYGGDPLALLAFEAPVAELKARLDAGEPVFENLIRTALLDNTHRATLILTPDESLGAKREEKEKQRLAEILSAMDDDERAEIVAATAELQAEQERPDPPEALAAIPRLQKGDLPRENTPIRRESGDVAGVELLSHDYPTNAIVYLDLAFDLAGLPAELLPWVGLFGRALTEMGTRDQDYVAFNRRIARDTGGIRPEPFVSAAMDGSACARLFVRAKAMTEKSEALAAIVKDMLTEVDFNDPKRFRQIVLEEKARMEQRVVPAGHMLVAGRLGARSGPAGLAAELIGGVDQLFFLRDLAQKLEDDWESVAGTLDEIRRLVLRREALVMGVTVDDGMKPRLEPGLAGIVAALPSGEAEQQSWSGRPYPPAEGLTIPAQVHYVGKTVGLYERGWEFSGTDLMAARYLRTGYLWDQVRVQGGAYGAFSMFDRLAGRLSFVSYRDPNLERTLGVFDKAADYLESFSPDEQELDKAVVGAVGDLDTYRLPDAKGFTSMVRRLTGQSDEALQRIREDILNAGPQAFSRFAEACRLLAREGEVVVMGPQESLREAGPDFTLTRVL